jgi:hypothetical protein
MKEVRLFGKSISRIVEAAGTGMDPPPAKALVSFADYARSEFRNLPCGRVTVMPPRRGRRTGADFTMVDVEPHETQRRGLVLLLTGDEVARIDG